jgi:hypothetical protein
MIEAVGQIRRSTPGHPRSSEAGMTGLSILLLLLGPPQDPKKANEEVDRTRKAVVIERLVVQPAMPGGVIRLPQGQVQEQAIVRRNVTVQAAKRVTLELKAVEADAEKVQDVQPGFRPGFNIIDMALSSDNFDRWVFEDERSEEVRKDRLYKILSDKIRWIEMDEKIGDEQLRRLRLAGNGDIKRFLDRVEAARVGFDAARQDYTAGRLALAQLQPLATEYKDGPFGTDSLFEKTLRKFRGDKKAATPEGK